jgi:hypothetical protein
MKHYLVLLSILMLMVGKVVAAPLTTEDAIAFLKKTQPQAGGVMEAIAQPQEITNLYQQQLDAITTISNDKDISCTSVLIPYLNYAVSPAAFIHGRHPMTSTEDIDITKNVWPAFRAILQMKDAGEQLRQYITNKQNSPNYRLAAFLVLRYVAKTDFQSLEHSLDSEFINSSPGVKEYLKHIEGGSEQFWGVPDLK